jgi:predicted Zn-dependent protease
VDISIVTKDFSGKAIADEEIRRVCLHEVGHALGLHRHSSNNFDIMFFSETKAGSPALTQRDRNTMARLYADYPVLNQMSYMPGQFAGRN